MDVFQIYIVKENVYCIANYNLPCTDDFVVYLQYQHFEADGQISTRLGGSV